MMDKGLVISMVEYQSKYLSRDEMTEAEVRFLFLHYRDKISVEFQPFDFDTPYKLTSMGWVGFIPLGGGKGLSIQPKVPLANLFEMLEYAYDLKSFQVLDGSYDCESVVDYFERLAIMLADGLLERARAGLYRTYLEEIEDLSFVRGSIDIPALARSPVKSRIRCRFEEQTIDNAENQILAWTLHCILRSGICSSRSISKIRRAEKVLAHSVTLLPFGSQDCVGRTYNRLNADYQTLHLLCRFFLEKTGPSQVQGQKSMIPFVVNMARLFESFVARWFDANIDERFYLVSQEKHEIGSRALTMHLDLVVYAKESGLPVCILDTKYKPDESISNPDYNQAVAYADAKNCGNAILIYPSIRSKSFDEKPGKVRVSSVVFDLDGNLDSAGREFNRRFASILG